MKKLLMIFILWVFVICADMFFIEPNLLFLKTEKIYVPNWNKQIDGFKIAVIADIHLGTKFVDLKKLDKIAQKVNKKRPDLVVFLGDLDAKSISYQEYKKEEIAEVLKSFSGKNGTIAIMGNHDYEPKNIIRPIYKEAAIPLLEHQDLFIYPNNIPVRLVGFKDLWHYKSSPLNIIGTKYKNTPTIVLAHNPDSFNEMPDFVSITLSGHTHGGEIVFPVIGSFVVPSKFGQRYRKGHIIENGKHLYVSCGVATTGRARLLNPPEITILEIHSLTKNTEIINTKPLKGINKNYAPILMPKIRNLLKALNKK